MDGNSNIDSVSKAIAEIIRETSIGSQFKIGFRWGFEFVRGGKIFYSSTAQNIVPTEGLNHILSVVGNSGTQTTTWYAYPFEGNYTPVAGDTAATFPASATEFTAYTEATRQEWVEAAPAGGVITNVANKAVFTANNGSLKTIYGGALVSSSVKGGVGGILLSAARAPASKPVTSGDIIRMTMDLTLTSS